MEKKEITTVSPVSTGGITVIPVSKVTAKSWKGKRCIAFSGSQQPDIIILVTPSGRRAFRITGEEVTPDQLTEEFPGISDKLEEA